MNTSTNSMTRLARVVKFAAAIATAISFPSTLQAQNTPAPPIASTDPPAEISYWAKELLNSAAQANLTEITMTDVAREKSKSAPVKAFAQMVSTDRQQNDAQLRAIAQVHGFTLPASPDAENQRGIDRLRKIGIVDFDQEYIKATITDYAKCVRSFDKEIARIDESDIKQYAQSTLLTLRSHLRKAEDVARSVGLDESTIAALLQRLPEGDEAVTVR